MVQEFGDTSPSESYILATLLRTPRFVGSVLSDGKLTLMVSLSFSYCRPSIEAPSFLEVRNCSFAYVSSSDTTTEHAVSNSFTFECHLCNSNGPLANIIHFLTQTLRVWNREGDVHVYIFNVWRCVEIFQIKLYEQICN